MSPPETVPALNSDNRRIAARQSCSCVRPSSAREVVVRNEATGRGLHQNAIDVLKTFSALLE